MNHHTNKNNLLKEKQIRNTIKHKVTESDNKLSLTLTNKIFTCTVRNKYGDTISRSKDANMMDAIENTLNNLP